MFKPSETDIQGCFIINLTKINDNRGYFLKNFNTDYFVQNEIEFTVREEYFSESHNNVIRGMHFQTPPFDHNKIVRCIQGSMLDVVLDIRKESKTFGKAISFELNGKNDQMIFIPKGCAHGFLSLEDQTIVQYLVSTTYSKENDEGILYNSFNFNWPCSNPIISPRDLGFKPFNQFPTPFKI